MEQKKNGTASELITSNLDPFSSLASQFASVADRKDKVKNHVVF